MREAINFEIETKQIIDTQEVEEEIAEQEEIPDNRRSCK
jgi:hypothetical protein